MCGGGGAEMMLLQTDFQKCKKVLRFDEQWVAWKPILHHGRGEEGAISAMYDRILEQSTMCHCLEGAEQSIRSSLIGAQLQSASATSATSATYPNYNVQVLHIPANGKSYGCCCMVLELNYFGWSTNVSQ